jgi:hypothetical protein
VCVYGRGRVCVRVRECVCVSVGGRERECVRVCVGERETCVCA